MNTQIVSVIITVYNVEQYLKQCLDSIIAQTFKNIEIIVVNDCSPDNSIKIIKEYQQKDDRIVLLNLKQNVGLGFARNEGMKIAKGKYITFVDSDDWISKDYVEVLYNNIEKNNLDIVCASTYFYDTYKKQIINTKHTPARILNNTTLETLLIPRKKNFIVPVWLKIYRKKFLLQNNIFFLLKTNEDNLFLFSIFLNTNKIKFIDNKIYYYRINRENSIIQTVNKSFSYFLLFNKLKELLIRNNKYNQYKQIYYQYISILTASKLETLNLSIPKLTVYFYKFKNLYYNKEFIDNFSIKNINILLKIRYILFYLCLKFNINYILIGRFCRKIIFFK